MLTAEALTRLRTVVALTSPFDVHERLDATVVRAHVAWLNERGVDGILVAGTTGEGASLDDDEIVDLVRTARAASDLPVLAHVGRVSTVGTLRLAHRTLDAGADAVAAVVPYYFPLDQRQIAAHYRRLLSDLGAAPVLAYAIPTHAGNDLEPDTFGVLLGEGLAGAKDSSKRIDRHAEYADQIRQAGVSASLFQGSESLVLRARSLGGSGSVTAMANVRPELVAAVHQAHDQDDAEGAERAQVALTAAREKLGPGGTARVIKAAVAHALAPLGVTYPGVVRSPL